MLQNIGSITAPSAMGVCHMQILALVSFTSYTLQGMIFIGCQLCSPRSTVYVATEVDF